MQCNCQDIPILTQKECNKHHLENKPNNFENICSVYSSHQKRIVFNDIVAFFRILKCSMLQPLKKLIYDWNDCLISHIVIELANPNSFDKPEKFKPWIKVAQN